MKPILIVFIVLSFTGCLSVNVKDTNEIKTETTKTYDEHQGMWYLEAPSVLVSGELLSGTSYRYYLQAWSKTGYFHSSETIIQLHVEVTLYDWAYINSAYSYGESFHLNKIDSEVFCLTAACYVTEEVGVILPPQKLEEMSKKTTMDIKLAGSASSIVVEIPGTYIRGFIAAF